MPFDEGTVVDVEEITDKDWRVLTPVRYHGITRHSMSRRATALTSLRSLGR